MTIFWCIVHSIQSRHTSHWCICLCPLLRTLLTPQHWEKVIQIVAQIRSVFQVLHLSEIYFLLILYQVQAAVVLKILLKILTLLETIFPKVFYHIPTLQEQNALNSKIIMQFSKENKKTSAYNFCVALLLRKIFKKIDYDLYLLKNPVLGI